MKLLNLIGFTLVLVLTSACTQKRKGPAAASQPKQSVPQQTTRITKMSNNVNADFTEREKIIESARIMLQDMGCQVTDTNLACAIPENQSKTEDLIKLLTTYHQVLVMQINSGLLSQEKLATYQVHQAPITSSGGYLAQLEYHSKNLFSKDSAEVLYAYQSLESMGIKFSQERNSKSRDGINIGKSYLVVSNTLLAYKTPTQVVKEINAYIDTVAWYLNIYSGSRHLSKDEREGYLNKVAQLEELAARIQRIGSKG